MVWLPIHRARSKLLRNMSEEMALGKAEQFQWEVLLGDTSVHAVFCLLFVLSICANFRVIYVVWARCLGRARKQGAVHLLILHLSLVVLGILGLTLAKIMDILTNFQGPIICRVMGFFKGALNCAFSTNMMAIVHERVIAPLQSNRSHILAGRLIALLWILPMFQGTLDVFTCMSLEEEKTVTEKHPISLGNCILVPMFGSHVATIINESFRFAVFHLVVTLYMAFAILKIWLSLNSLYKISAANSNHFEKKLQSIRYILIHLATFIIFWIPIGFFAFTRRLFFSGIPVFEESPKDWLYQSIKEETSFLNKFIGLSTLIFLSVNPIINLFLLDYNNIKVCSCKADAFSDVSSSSISPPPPLPPPLVSDSETGEMYGMGYLNKKQSGSTPVVCTTGELQGYERESSKESSDMEACAAKMVKANVIVHAVDQEDNESKANGYFKGTEELEESSFEDMI